MAQPSSLPTAPLTAVGLVGGYAAGRITGVRPLGGVVLAAAGVAAGRSWSRTVGTGRTAALLATYVGGFGLAHPLSKKIGSWPAVLTAAGTSAAASWALADRHR